MKMKKRMLAFALLAVLFVSCDDDDDTVVISQGDYPVKEYYFERDPSVNVWGVGMDFINEECSLDETDLDYEYLTADSEFEYDIKFYTVKVYYVDDVQDTLTEGCPAMLLNEDIQACKIGEGIDFFDSCTLVTEDMLYELSTEPTADYASCFDESAGYYIQDSLFVVIDSCIIGRSFRSNVLVIPDGMTEEEVQAVYLVKSAEGGYSKFMVHQYKGDAPYTKQTLVRWQVISE
jgi:hypothetical protein